MVALPVARTTAAIARGPAFRRSWKAAAPVGGVRASVTGRAAPVPTVAIVAVLAAGVGPSAVELLWPTVAERGCG